jgi:plastocyanin
MRKTLLTSAALFAVVVTAPALTQITVTPPTEPGSSGTAEPAPPNSEPVTGKPTESGAAPGGSTTGGTPQEQTTSQPANNKPVEYAPAASERRPHQGVQRRSPAAPRSTKASVDEKNASADQYLRDAQTALRERRIREAREALERAETRVLNSVPDTNAGSAPDTNAGKNSTVDTIERAREALGHVRYLRPDLARGRQMIDHAMSETESKSTRAETIRIGVDKLTFTPASVSAHTGDTIEWANSDPVAHTATARGKEWDVTIPAKGIGRATLKTAGIIDYYCRFHPNMVGRVSVAD